jgi:hypothetical protein
MISEPYGSPDLAKDPRGNARPSRTSTVLLVVAWAIVGIPALWGVSQTVRTSANLFERPTTQPAAAATQPATASK